MAWDKRTNQEVRWRMGDKAREEARLIRSDMEVYSDCFDRAEKAKIKALLKALDEVGKIG